MVITPNFLVAKKNGGSGDVSKRRIKYPPWVMVSMRLEGLAR